MLPLCLLGASAVCAQTTPPITSGDGVNGAPPPDVKMQRNPNPPQGNGAPVTTAPKSDDRLLVIDADRVYTIPSGEDQGTIVGEGHVHLVWRGYDITSDRATYNRDKHTATFENNVVLNSGTGTQTIYADFVSLNLRTREFVSRQARSIVPQEYLGPNILQPIRISGEEVTREGDIVSAKNGVLTTCDYPDPHYRIGFARATLIPNKRIVLRNAVFYDSKGKAVARIAYLSIPISKEIRYTYLPMVGRTDEEGYYVKTAVGYTGSKQLPAGIARVDFMEKKGIGLGIDQAYKFGKDIIGTFVLYSLRDQSRNVNNLSGSLNHHERFGPTLLTVASSFQNNSYTSISPESKSSTTNITANRVVGPSNTNVNLNLGSSSYSGLSTSKTTTYTVQQTETLGPASSLVFSLTGSQSDSNSGTTGGAGTSNVRTEQLGDVKATARAGVFDVALTTTKNLISKSSVTSTSTDGTSTTQSADYYSGTERLPDVSLTTNTTRLGFMQSVPTQFTVGWGELVAGTPGARVDTQRAMFDVNSTPRPIPLTSGGRLSLTENNDFRQIVYSQQDTAQYILSNQTALTQRFSKIDTLSFTYGYIRPYGGEPTGFTIDQTGTTNNLGANYTLTGGGAKLTLITGYDIHRANETDLPAGYPRNPWQALSVQLAVRNSDKFQTRFTSSYDWNTGRLLQTTNSSRIRMGSGGPALDTSLSFDPATKKFPQVTGTLLTPLFRPDLTLAAYAGYNGQTYRFDYRTFTLTKSYHDYEISVSYVDQPYGYRTQKGINFSIRLKAFPTATTTPAGQFGTSINTNSTGDVF